MDSFSTALGGCLKWAKETGSEFNLEISTLRFNANFCSLNVDTSI